jgi:hypothetical protein
MDTWASSKYTRGFIAWIMLVFIVIMSLPFIRRRAFEVFMTTHFAFVAFFVFVYLHTPLQSWPYIAAAAVLYGIDKALRVVWGLFPRRATVEICEDMLRIRFAKDCIAKATGLYRPGQYVREQCFDTSHV